MADIEIPSRQYTLDQVKEQSAILVINSVDFVYEIYAHQIKRGLVPDQISDNVPDRFKATSDEDIREDGVMLIQDYITWYRQAPRAEQVDVIETVSTPTHTNETSDRLRNLFTNIMENPSELKSSDIITIHDTLRNKMHRSKDFRDTWLLHNEDTVIDIDDDTYMVTDDVWQDNMREFSHQVRKVLDDLDLDRDARESIKRQGDMRQLLRMAGLRPIPIINAPITGRPQPILDRIN